MSLLNVNPAALKSLQDKVVVLTGGCSGIGHATAIEFLSIFLVTALIIRRKMLT